MPLLAWCFYILVYILCWPENCVDRFAQNERPTKSMHCVKYFVLWKTLHGTTDIMVAVVFIRIELLCWCIMCLAVWSRLSIVPHYQYNRLERFVWTSERTHQTKHTANSTRVDLIKKEKTTAERTRDDIIGRYCYCYCWRCFRIQRM